MKKTAKRIVFAVLMAAILGVGAEASTSVYSNDNDGQGRSYCPLIEPDKKPERSQRGCCSHHGGVLGCADNGRTVCRDCSYSPTCRCK